MKNIFDLAETNAMVSRINRLHPDSKALWGKMTVAQMLAHCNVTYELVYDNKHPQPSAFKKWILKLLVKDTVVSEKPYKKNSPTAGEFKIKETKDFEIEKKRLIDYIIQTQALGGAFFDQKESHSFGALTQEEWNNMFFKHLNHHMQQFGV